MMFSEKIIKINSYLLLLLPIALITGPFVSDLIVILSCLSLFFFFNFFEINNLKNKLVLMLFSLWLVSIISSFFSTDFFFSIKSSFFYIRIIIFSLFVNELFKFYDKNLNKLLNILLLIFIFLFIDSCFQRYFGYNIIGIAMSNEVRVSSFFGNELILGGYLVKFYPIIIGLLSLIRLKNFFLYFSGISIITFITVFLSAEKSAIAIFFY